MPEGLIVKALSGYYYVLPDDSLTNTIQCRARGILKLKEISPLVGDRVIYELTENGEGTVNDVLPRFSELTRPTIANVKQVVLVFSIDEPALNMQLLDKFLVHTEQANMETIICFSKQDLIEHFDMKSNHDLDVERIIKMYSDIGYQTVITSAVKEEGMDKLLQLLKGNISVFAGQSGVGKSTLLNKIVPGLQLITSQVSKKLGSGRHTTRHVELIPLLQGGLVADTPGFSQLDFLNIEAEDIAYGFREFRIFAEQCKFRRCLHRSEPNCKVIEALENKEIAEIRYGHYLLFLDEIKDRKRRY